MAIHDASDSVERRNAPLAIVVMMIVALMGFLSPPVASAVVLPADPAAAEPRMPFDMDGDGVDDEIIAEPRFDPDASVPGWVRVISGADGRVLRFFVGEQVSDYFGYIAVPAGDLNTDGHDDVAVSAPRFLQGELRGRVQVFCGRRGIPLMTLVGRSGETFGTKIEPVPDVDMDGQHDLKVWSHVQDASRNIFETASLYSGRDGGLLNSGNDSSQRLVRRAVDVDGNGRVDIADVQAVLQQLGSHTSLTDVDGDSIVTAVDVGMILTELRAGSSEANSTPVLPRLPEAPIAGLTPHPTSTAGLAREAAAAPGGGNDQGSCLVRRTNGDSCSASSIYTTYRRMTPEENSITLNYRGWCDPVWSVSGTADFEWSINPNCSDRIRVTVYSPGDVIVSVQCGGGCSGFESIVTRVWRGDVDIDGDNNNGLGRPDRTMVEEQSEGANGGKVVLANSLDSDRDGLPDYADGYDLLGAAATIDDRSAGGQFVPIIIEVENVDYATASLIIEYSASDPLAMTPTLQRPFNVPTIGNRRCRLWFTGMPDERDPRPFSEGGDYLAPGEYSLKDLGISGGNTEIQILLESILWFPNSSTTNYVSITFRPNGMPFDINHRDQLQVTQAGTQLRARALNGTDFFDVDALVATQLENPFDPEPAVPGTSPGPYLTYKAFVRNQRQTGTSTLLINGQSLPLTRPDPNVAIYETPEFICLNPDQVFGPSLPPYPVVVLNDDAAEVLYNPFWNWPSDSDAPLKGFFGWDRSLSKDITAVVTEMEAQGWTPSNPNDSGAFGKEVHRRVSVRLVGQNRWVTDVWAHNTTREVVGFGEVRPPGYPITALTQIDILRVKSGYQVAVGQVLDPSRIDDLYDIKTSIDGAMTENQEDRLKNFINGRRVKVAQTLRRWTLAQGWIENPVVARRGRLIKFVGLASTAIAVLSFAELERSYAETVEPFLAAAERTNVPFKREIFLLDAINATREYLRNFSPDPSLVDGIGILMMYKVIGADDE